VAISTEEIVEEANPNKLPFEEIEFITNISFDIYY
jgi:hypothetical protein